MNLAQFLLPHNVEHGIFFLQLAQTDKPGVGIHFGGKLYLIGQYRLQRGCFGVGLGAKTLTWTVPEGGQYHVFYLWMQGTAQESSPAVKPSYCVNYFDARGVEAFKTYFKDNVLNDPVLNEKIKKDELKKSL